jgi:hypothetical protein
MGPCSNIDHDDRLCLPRYGLRPHSGGPQCLAWLVTNDSLTSGFSFAAKSLAKAE